MSGSTPSVSNARHVPQRPGAAHHLVGDHQHAVFVANLAHPLGIAGRRRDAAAGGAHHRFEDEGRDLVGPDLQDFIFKFLGAGLARRFAPIGPVGIGGRQVRNIQKGTFKGGLPLQEARHRQGPKRIAMPAPFARNETAARHLAPGRMILQRQLQAAFHGLRTARDIHHVLQRAAANTADDLRQFLQGIGGEVVAIAMGNPVELRLDGVIHFRVGMPDAINGGSARAVDILLAVDVVKIAALGPDNLGQSTGGMNIGRKGRRGRHVEIHLAKSGGFMRY